MCINQCCVQHLRGPSAHSVCSTLSFLVLGPMSSGYFGVPVLSRRVPSTQLRESMVLPHNSLPYKMVWKLKALSWGDGKTHFVSHLSGITVFLLSDIQCLRSHFSRIFVCFFSLVISGRTNSVLFYSFWPEANLKLVCYWFFNLGSPLLLLPHLCPLLLKSETHEHFTEFYVEITIIFIFLILVLSNWPIILSVVSREISNSGSVAF